MEIHDKHLYIITHMLRSRMIRLNNSSANILDPEMALVTKASIHIGKYLGYFMRWDEKKCCFILYCRNDLNIQGDINQSFVFIINMDLDDVPSNISNEIKRFCGSSVNLSVTNVGMMIIKSPEPLMNELSVLLETAEVSIRPTIMDNIKPKVVIEAPVRSCSYSIANSLSNIGSCQVHRKVPDTASRIILSLKRHGYIFREYNIEGTENLGTDLNQS